MVRADPTARYADIDYDSASANMTAASLSKRAFAPDEWRCDIRTGGPEQHIGTLGKKRLYKKLIAAFERLGAPHTKGCREGDEFCKDSSACCYDGVKLPNIVYDSGDGTYATNSHVTVKLWWSEIYDNAHKGLRDAAVSGVCRVRHRSN